MKQYIFFVLIGLPLLLQSSSELAMGTLNANSWSLRIGNKVLLASWKNNKMGDTVAVKLSKLNANDLVKAERFLCGQSLAWATSSLIIKDKQNVTICTSSKKSQSISFAASLPLKEVVKHKKSKTPYIVSVYFNIEHTSTKEPENCALLGVLILE